MIEKRNLAQRQFDTERYILSTFPVLYTPLWKRDGDAFISDDGIGHTCTVTNALWTLQGRSFDGDDNIDCGSNSVLNFTSGDFSLFSWIKTGAMVASIRAVFARSALNVSGYDLYVRGNAPIATPNELRLTTRQAAGASQTTASAQGTILDNTTYFVGATRSGATVKLCINGVEPAYRAQGTHIDPATSTSNAYIGNGITTLNTYPFIGTIGEVLIYNRALSATEWMNIYLATKWRYGL